MGTSQIRSTKTYLKITPRGARRMSKHVWCFFVGLAKKDNFAASPNLNFRTGADTMVCKRGAFSPVFVDYAGN